MIPFDFRRPSLFLSCCASSCACGSDRQPPTTVRCVSDSNSNSNSSTASKQASKQQTPYPVIVINMLSRTAAVRKFLPRTLARAFSSEEAATSVTLNFSVPYESIYNGAKVFQVIVPGVEGEYGVTPNHVPYVAQLKPGVLQILHEEGLGDSEKYFVAGGYALTHANSVTVSLVTVNNAATTFGM